MKDNRQLENKTRLTINGKRYRVGNPNHPHYALYKEQGMEAVLEAMGLVEVKVVEESKDEFPWSSLIFVTVIVSLILFTTVGN
jgi:hypothetical protein